MPSTLSHPDVVSQEAWMKAHAAHLAKEKEFTRLRDELARTRRELPWTKVEKTYVFETPQGKRTLADLFAGRSQLVVYHFMFGPEWQEGCPSCSFIADHINGAVPHLAARDVTLTMISRAPLPKIEAFKRRMGWQFPWVSSSGNDFNFDFRVSFKPEQLASGSVEYNFTRKSFPSEEAPGASVFYKDPASGTIYHTFSTFERGLDPLLGTYTLLDMTPKGRDESELPFTMAWLRYHDRYEHSGAFADANKPYWPEVMSASDTSAKTPSCCHSKSAAVEVRS